MTLRKAKVSVIIPLYNRAEFIEECVRSVLATQYKSLDLLVVDDGSTDAGPAFVQKWVQSHPEAIRLVRHPGAEHRGVSAARNLGLRLSAGEFITFLDSDDLMYPWRLDGAVELLETHREIDAVYDRAEEFDSKSGAILAPFQLPEDPRWNEGLQSGQGFHLPGIPGTGSMVVRRELFDVTGGFDEEKWVGEDINMWFRIYAAGRLVPGPERRPVVRFRRHAGNTTGFDPAWIQLREFASVYHWARKKKCPDQKIDYLRQRYFGHLYNFIGCERAAGGNVLREARMLAHAQFHFPASFLDSKFLRNAGCLAARWKFRRK